MSIMKIRELIRETELELEVAKCKFNMKLNELDIDLAIIDIDAAEKKLKRLHSEVREME